MRALVVGLVLGLSGCVPVAMLRPPEPARGTEWSLGGTLSANPFGGRSPVLLLPYLGYAQGDGVWEYNLSLQWGLRGGVKLGLTPGVAWMRASPSRPFWARGRTGARGCPWTWTGGSSWAGEGTTSRPGSISWGFRDRGGVWPTSFRRGCTAGSGWER